MGLSTCKASSSYRRNMRRIIFASIVGFSLPSWSNPDSALPPGLIGQVKTSLRNSVCTCEYYRTYGKAEELVLKRSCDLEDSAIAFMKIDEDSVALTPANAKAISGCVSGRAFHEVWIGPGLEVRFTGYFTGEGPEACWQKGEIAVSKGNKKQIMKVTGACGI